MPDAKDNLKDDLREMIERKQIVVVVGSGVSIASTNRKAPTWPALINAAANRCVALGASEAWSQGVRNNLAIEGELDFLLAAAELVHTKLRTFGEGEFARWLRELLEPLEPADTSLIEAIDALDAQIITTNYDDLMEKVTDLKHITWLDASEISRDLRGDDRRVLHLHGHLRQPESVVLGIRSYEAVSKHNHTQSALKAIGMTKSFVFVGCGDDGLSDPDFGNFLSWLKETEEAAGVQHRHYRLVRNSEDVKQQGRIYPLPYGDKHSDLPGFIQELNSAARKRRKKPAKKTARGRNTTPGKSSKKRTATRTDAVTAYLSRLAEETSHLKLLGFGRSLQIELPIGDAYVPLKAHLSRSLELKPTERYAERLGDAEVNVELEEMFQQTRKPAHRGVVLLGEPGAGKTTGARQIAFRLASGECPPKTFGLPNDITPVLLRFRNLSQQALAEQNGLHTFLTEQTACNTAKDGLTSPGGDLWNGGPLLWILDGLDEVIDPAARRAVSRWVQEAIAERTDDYFLVTCRFAGYYRDGVVLGPRFSEFHVRPLSDDQVTDFVHRWYAAAYETLRLSPELAVERATALLGRLALPEYRAGRLPELRTNPQLLTLLCIVFHDKQQLPDNRAELYAECIMVFLQHWRREVFEAELGSEVPGFDAKAAQSVLAQLAWWMHSEQDRTSAAIDDLKVEAETALQSLQPESGLGYDGQVFLDRMKDETGILASDTGGHCGFLHLSFQEYLAADYAVSHRMAVVLAERMHIPWWREVGLLSLRHEKLFCEDFFRSMLAIGTAEQDPDLAERILTESLYFSPTPRVATVLRLLRSRSAQVHGLADLVVPLADSDDAAVRSAAGELLAKMGIAQPETPQGSPLVVSSPAKITFVRIPAGDFQMGSAVSEFDLERPAHPVHISEDFLLGRYPVTNAQYAEYLKSAGKKSAKPGHWDDRRFNQPEQPVVGVSWEDAQAFCQWADCRLPTEAEWEYACRAGTSTEYSFGDDAKLLEEFGWYNKNSSGQSQPVGTKLPNPWGLHDMHGNVWEWCQDWFGEDYYSKSPTVDPTGPDAGKGRVLRGGSWDFRAGYCRSSIRDDYRPVVRDYNVGFRVARTL